MKLKLQYFGHRMWRADSQEKTLILGKTEGKGRRGWQKMTWLDSITNSMDMDLSKLWEMVEDRGVWRAAVHGVAKSQTASWLNKTKETMSQEVLYCLKILIINARDLIDNRYRFSIFLLSVLVISIFQVNYCIIWFVRFIDIDLFFSYFNIFTIVLIPSLSLPILKFCIFFFLGQFA